MRQTLSPDGGSASWTKVPAPGADDDGAADAAGDEEDAPAAGDGEDADAASSPSSPRAPPLFRWKKEHSVTVDDEFVLELNRDPLVPFFVFRDEVKATFARFQPFPCSLKPSRADRSSLQTSTDEEGETSGALAHYHHTTILDLSPMLSGHTVVSRTFGGHPTALAWAEEEAAATLGDAGANDEASVRSATSAASQTSQRSGEGSVTASVASKGGAKQFVESSLNQGAACAYRPPRGVAYLRITLVLVNGEPLLDTDEMSRLNPLTITVDSARDLPGVRVEALSLQRFVEKSPYSLQEQYCKDTYAVLQPIVPELGPRLVATEGQPTGASVAWDYTTSFLTGSVDRHIFEEAMEMLPLRVEIHDRDPTDGDPLARYERLVLGEEAVDPDAEVQPSGGAAEAAGDAEDDGEVGAEEAEAPAGMDPFDVDKIYLKELVESWRTAGDNFSHGTATFRLNALLDQAKPLAAAFARSNSKHQNVTNESLWVKMRENILPTKKRVMPKGGEDDWALKEGERLVRKPGHYMATDASIRLQLRLHRPYRSLEEDEWESHQGTLETRPFSRAVFCFEYYNVPMLHAVNNGIDAINNRALGDTIQGSLRSHQLTPEQVEGANNGTLDVVGGFQIIDYHCRMIVVEGLVGAVQRLMDVVPRANANDFACRILSNPQVCFHKRLYTLFNVDLKKIKLRDPLPILCEMPEIYNRTKVSTECFEALHRLQAIRKANRLLELSQQSMFPLVEQLLQVESKYGESISMEDIDGRKVSPKKSRISTRGARAMQATQDAAASSTAEAAGALETKAVSERRKAPTDSFNPLFEQSLKERTTRDYLQEQSEVLDETLKAYEEQKKVLAEERAADPVPVQFVYSGQKLQYTELKKGEMRSKLAREKNSHFTYSTEFLSAAVSMVDETRLRLDAEAEAKARWKTKRGFVYPAPKKTSEFYVHPNKPSDSRIDILKEPWVENEMHPKPQGRSVVLPEGQPDFDCIPAQGKALFGGLYAPKFERPYDNNNLGSETRLPRGRMTLGKNPAFYKSVHLSGAAGAKEEEEDRKAEAELWKSKVVVDSLDFKVGGFTTRDKPMQSSKTDDILKGPVLNKAMRIVRNARLPSGKKVPLRPAPFSMFCREEYDDPKDFTADLRKDEPSTYLATSSSGAPLDFVTHIHRDTNYPKAQTIRSFTAIPPMAATEKVGERWDRR